MLNKAGENTVELLIWSQGKSQSQVKRRIDLILNRSGSSSENELNIEQIKYNGGEADNGRNSLDNLGKKDTVEKEFINQIGEQQQSEAWMLENISE